MRPVFNLTCNVLYVNNLWIVSRHYVIFIFGF
jgi:hypothetical protein